MAISKSRGGGEVKNTLDPYEKNGGGECVMCKFVLVFAFVVLLLVLIFTFFLRVKLPGSEAALNKPLPPELTPPMTDERFNKELFELGKVFHPEMASSTPNTSPTVSPPLQTVQSTDALEAKHK